MIVADLMKCHEPYSFSPQKHCSNCQGYHTPTFSSPSFFPYKNEMSICKYFYVRPYLFGAVQSEN
uniref:Uncharacterized protein n=1 Tax=Lepeophtheirus salmonis TaxID=72036 RepID=A0A0K2UP96_LEPSM